MKRIVLVSILLLFGKYLLGQECRHFHLGVECRLDNIGGYKLNNQSKGVSIQYGVVNKFQVALIGNYEYKINVCSQPGFGTIHFRIINTEDQRVIYDNEKHKYAQDLTLSNDATKIVILEISFIDTEENAKAIWDTGICLGILIYWHNLETEG